MLLHSLLALLQQPLPLTFLPVQLSKIFTSFAIISNYSLLKNSNDSF
nr:MAG TPA: hypothetical protein [Caudoviricetes sp.]